jgi:hypothetical protein
MREPLLQSSDLCSVKGLEPRQSKGLKRRLRDLIDEKRRKLEIRAKSMKNISSIDCVAIGLQSVMGYTYIGSRAQLFESDTTKSFLNKLNLKPYSDSTYSGFCDSGFWLGFPPYSLLDTF